MVAKAVGAEPTTSMICYVLIMYFLTDMSEVLHVVKYVSVDCMSIRLRYCRGVCYECACLCIGLTEILYTVVLL